MNCVRQHCRRFTGIVEATIPSQPSAVNFGWSIQSFVRILHSSLSICTYLLLLLLEFLTGIFMLRNCYCYFFHSLHGDFCVCSSYRQGDDTCISDYSSSHFLVIVLNMKVSSTRRYLCHGFCSTTTCNRQSSRYCRVDNTCNAASSVLLCSLRFQAVGYRRGDNTRVPVSSSGGYAHVREVIIVVATIPSALSLHYLHQPIPLLSLPRRYHRRLLVSAGPCGDCNHMKVNNSIFRMTVEVRVSPYRFLKRPFEAIPRSVLPILSSLTVQTKL